MKCIKILQIQVKCIQLSSPCNWTRWALAGITARKTCSKKDSTISLIIKYFFPLLFRVLSATVPEHWCIFWGRSFYVKSCEFGWVRWSTKWVPPSHFLNSPPPINSLSFELWRNGLVVGHWKTNAMVFDLNPHCCKIWKDLKDCIKIFKYL